MLLLWAATGPVTVQLCSSYHVRPTEVWFYCVLPLEHLSFFSSSPFLVEIRTGCVCRISAHGYTVSLILSQEACRMLT